MEKDGLFNRAMDLCLRVIRMTGHLPETYSSETITEELVRSAAHIVIHYRNSGKTGSAGEAIEKLQRAIDVAFNVIFWLEIIEGCEMIKADRLAGLKQETNEIISLLEAAVKSFSRTRPRKKA